MDLTYKELCMRILNSETEEVCQRIHMILQHIEEASLHADRGILCDKLELEARVFNHLTAT